MFIHIFAVSLISFCSMEISILLLKCFNLSDFSTIDLKNKKNIKKCYSVVPEVILQNFGKISLKIRFQIQLAFFSLFFDFWSQNGSKMAPKSSPRRSQDALGAKFASDVASGDVFPFSPNLAHFLHILAKFQPNQHMMP